MAGEKKCPFSHDPCMGRECHLWDAMEVIDQPSGQARIQEDCCFKLSFIANRSAAMRTHEGAAAMDKVASRMFQGNSILAALETGQAKLVKVNGGED